MKYDKPIQSPEHAAFCRREAELRYRGVLVRDQFGMVLVRDAHGVEHTDAVLRALSSYTDDPALRDL